MQVATIRRVSVPVSDPDRTREFYERALGFEMVEDVPVPMEEGARWVELAPPAGGASIVLVTWLASMTPGGVDGLMLETKDVGALCERVRGAGIAVEGPFDTPWGRQARLADSDGNGIVLTEPAASAG